MKLEWSKRNEDFGWLNFFKKTMAEMTVMAKSEELFREMVEGNDDDKSRIKSASCKAGSR